MHSKGRAATAHRRQRKHPGGYNDTRNEEPPRRHRSTATRYDHSTTGNPYPCGETRCTEGIGEPMAKFQVPEASIRFLLGRMHVSTSDADVEKDIRRRLVASQTTPAQRNACVKYALKCHRENQALYCRVIYG